MIYTIKLGGVNCFLVRENGMVLIDAGIPRRHNSFCRQMKKLGFDPQDIQLIIITHGHADHFGSAKKIKKLTKARLMIHRNDADICQRREKGFPP